MFVKFMNYGLPIIALVLAIIALMISGCMEGTTQKAGNLAVVYLDDGTRCAVYKGGYAGGLSCDWSGQKRDNPPPQGEKDKK